MTQNELTEKVITAVETNIRQTEIMISYLQKLKKTMNKDEKAQTDLKILALERDIKFNKEYVEHAKSL